MATPPPLVVVQYQGRRRELGHGPRLWGGIHRRSRGSDVAGTHPHHRHRFHPLRPDVRRGECLGRGLLPARGPPRALPTQLPEASAHATPRSRRGAADPCRTDPGLRPSRGYVEMICTRGPSVDGSRDPRTFVNRFYAFAIPYVWILDPRDTERGMDAVIARTARRIPTDSVDPTVKNFNWGDLTRGLFEAYDRGADHVLLLDHRDNLTEGPGYNVFAIVDERLTTPSSGVLDGITRRTVLELAQAEGLLTAETDLSESDVQAATELFATSTAGGIMPIPRLDGRPVEDGQVGAVTRRLRELYWAAHLEGPFVTRVLPASP